MGLAGSTIGLMVLVDTTNTKNEVSYYVLLPAVDS